MEVDTLVVDKTGTLTQGRPSVDRVVVVPGSSRREDDVLRLAAAVERGSEHPLGEAVVRAAADRGLQLPAVTGFEAPAGRGVSGLVDGHRVAVGSAGLLRSTGLDSARAEQVADEVRSGGAIAVLVAVDEEVVVAVSRSATRSRTAPPRRCSSFGPPGWTSSC